jgi:putative ABC transport system permease protein
MDQASSRIYGPRTVGSETEIHGHRVRVVGEYRHGAGFIASGSMVVSDRTFARISDFGDVERPSMGLIRWEPGAPPEETLRLLRASLPADVVVWSREELERREQHLFMTVKPIGIMFTSGAIIAFLVGAVILFQILTTEVAHRRREYATLRAMGYTSWDLKRLVLEEGFFMVAMGFLPAGLLSWYLYGVVNAAVKLPLFMSWDRVATVLALSLLMGGGSGLLAIRKVNAADPAELF